MTFKSSRKDYWAGEFVNLICPFDFGFLNFRVAIIGSYRITRKLKEYNTNNGWNKTINKGDESMKKLIITMLVAMNIGGVFASDVCILLEQKGSIRFEVFTECTNTEHSQEFTRLKGEYSYIAAGKADAIKFLLNNQYKLQEGNVYIKP